MIAITNKSTMPEKNLRVNPAKSDRVSLGSAGTDRQFSRYERAMSLSEITRIDFRSSPGRAGCCSISGSIGFSVTVDSMANDSLTIDSTAVAAMTAVSTRVGSAIGDSTAIDSLCDSNESFAINSSVTISTGSTFGCGDATIVSFRLLSTGVSLTSVAAKACASGSKAGAKPV